MGRVPNCVFMILVNGENYPVPARKSKVKYPTRLGKNNQIPDPLDTRKFEKKKYPTRLIPGKSLPDPSLFGTEQGQRVPLSEEFFSMPGKVTTFVVISTKSGGGVTSPLSSHPLTGTPHALEHKTIFK